MGSKPRCNVKLAHWAFAAYLLSYAMPAVMIAGDHLFGVFAAYFSIIGMASMGRLESGQWPACVLGVLANICIISGYIAFNWRRKSKGGGSYRAECWLAALAATFALGSGLSLAAGAESFLPNIGYLVWLGSMITMSIAYGTKTKGPAGETASPDDAEPCKKKKPRSKLRFYLLIGLLMVGPMWWIGLKIQREWAGYRITKDLSALLVEGLSALPDTHEIPQLCGKFERLSDAGVSCPDHFWALDTSLRFHATAHFEKGKTSVLLRIRGGRAYHPEVGGLELPAFPSHDKLTGWFKHPNSY